MNEPKYTEAQIQQTLRDSENSLDRSTLSSLAQARDAALQPQNNLLGGFRGLFSAGLVTTALVVAVLLPLTNDSPTGVSSDIDIADENLQLLMEDPEFFLWVSSSYGSLSQ